MRLRRERRRGGESGRTGPPSGRNRIAGRRKNAAAWAKIARHNSAAAHCARIKRKNVEFPRPSHNNAAALSYCGNISGACRAALAQENISMQMSRAEAVRETPRWKISKSARHPAACVTPPLPSAAADWFSGIRLPAGESSGWRNGAINNGYAAAGKKFR